MARQVVPLLLFLPAWAGGSLASLPASRLSAGGGARAAAATEPKSPGTAGRPWSSPGVRPDTEPPGAGSAARRDTQPPVVATAAPPVSGHTGLPAFLAAADTDRVFSAGGADTVPEMVLLDLRLARLVGATVQAYRVRTEALLPLTQVLNLAEVRYSLTPEGRLEATVDPGARRLIVDATQDTMAFGERRVRSEPAFKLWKDGELYVGAERLGDLLGIQIVVDWTELTVTMMDPDELPIAMRARREAAREAFRRRVAGVPVDYAFGQERGRFGGMVLDYLYYAPGGQDLTAGSYNARLGADAFGGSLVLGVQSTGPANTGAVRGEASWTGVWESNPWLKQVIVGDGYGTGIFPRTVRGMSITNSPYLRPPLVGVARYPGRLEPGWSIEAYQNGQIVALDSTDAAGVFGIDLPVLYGENPVDFVAYGPLGQVRTFNQTYRILADLLPAKRLEYGVAGGECRDLTCDATANVDLHYGLSARWTLRGGLDQFWRSSGDLTHPYAEVTANPTNWSSLDLLGVGNGYVQGVAQYEPSLNLRVLAVGAVYDQSVHAPLTFPAGRHSFWALNGFVRPIPQSGFFYLEGLLDETRADAGTLTRLRLGASFQTREMRILPYVRTERNGPPGGPRLRQDFIGANAMVLPRPQWGPVLGSLTIRGGAEAAVLSGASRVMSWYAFAAYPVWRGVSLEGGATWTAGGRGATLLFTLNTYLSAFRYFSTVSAPATGSATVSQFIQGSVLYDDASHRISAAPGPSIERGGLAGRVFIDQNLNGRYDSGEPGVPNVRVLVDSRSAVADSNGNFVMWDLVPFETLRVWVDSLSIDSPLLVPEFASASVIPSPNRFRTLDIPISPAGVIEGRVWREVDGAKLGMPAVTLVLTDTQRGVKRRFAAFSDGGFYLMGIKPGDYELTVDPRVLEAWHLAADPIRFTIGVSAEQMGRSGLDLTLRPAP